MAAEPLLRTRSLTAGYRSVRVIHDVDIEVAAGKIVAVIGPNGAGKTTLARSLAGFTRVFDGNIQFAAQSVTEWPPERRARFGMASVPEGRRLFPALTVEHNLELALFSRWAALGRQRRSDLLAGIFVRFPALAKRRTQRAGSLSGGEQQMLALGRALLLEPKLLVLDEPSTGLAPLIVVEIFRALRDIVSTQNCGCLLIEQQAVTALEIADFAYVLDRGEVVGADAPATLLADSGLRERYLGRRRLDAGS